MDGNLVAFALQKNRSRREVQLPWFALPGPSKSDNESPLLPWVYTIAACRIGDLALFKSPGGGDAGFVFKLPYQVPGSQAWLGLTGFTTPHWWGSVSGCDWVWDSG